jgi:aminomethyltransferase
MLRKTPLHDSHLRSGARMVDFGGWEMPVHYGSQVEEHHAVRRDCGVFDVSHMRAVDLRRAADAGAGADAATAFLRHLLANDVDRVGAGRAIYSCMLDAMGGVIDDLIVYRAPAPGIDYRIVVNAGNADEDIAWMQRHLGEMGLALTIEPRPDLAILAVQGPRARELVGRAHPAFAQAAAGLKAFHAQAVDDPAGRPGDRFVARTGYTGEDGCELMVPAAQAPALWDELVRAGARPCGLGARDTLRLEAGMNLHGNDMDESVSPLESGLAWTVMLAPGRDFVGRTALERQLAAGGLRQLLGIKLLERGVLRSHQVVHTARGEGVTTSGTFSPTLGCAIALARLPAGVQAGDTVQVEMRAGRSPATVVRPPFVRDGKARV